MSTVGEKIADDATNLSRN